MKGAGGSGGGIGQFFLGIAMFIGGMYLFLNNVSVTNTFSMSSSLYRIGGGFSVTTGLILIPFIIGVGIIFFNTKNILGWILSIGSLGLLVFGIISNMRFIWKTLTAFETILIVVLIAGGLGLFFRSLRSVEAE